MRFTITNGTVRVRPTVATPVVPTAPVLGTCEDCEADLVPLTDNAGSVRTTFCEYCEYGI